MGTLHLKFHSCLRLRFPEVEKNPGPRSPVAASCRILCSNVRVCPGTLVTWPWLRLSMIYCCALRALSQIWVTCQSCSFLSFGRPVLLCRGNLPRARGMAAFRQPKPYPLPRARGYGAFRQPKFECGCSEMLVVWVCGLRQNFYVYSLYPNPDQDNCIYDCLLTSMAAVLAEDVRASFLFVGDLNGHHQEWSGSSMTNSHGVPAFDFATVSVVISWLSARPMHVVEYLTAWWLMFLTLFRLLL